MFKTPAVPGFQIWPLYFSMNVDLFEFDLPEDNIALRPAVPRGTARLLHIAPSQPLGDFHMRDLPALLRPGDALVFNDTRVIPARLEGKRHRDGAVAHIGAMLHMRVAPDSWEAFVRPAKRLRQGEKIIFSRNRTFPVKAETTFASGQCGRLKNLKPAHCLNEQWAGSDINLVASVAEKGDAGEMLLVFDRAGAMLDAAIALVGHVPLPPYIAARRAEDAQDRIDYQTIYAREEGAVAAPTAGLHFTADLLEKLKEHGIEEHFVTLHVGAGTFLPVKTEDTEDHKMHAETGHIDAATAARLMAVKARGGRVVAVGTTALRLLESAASTTGQLKAWSGATDIFITPGYRFRFVDRLITNFHLPRSTLFMLVSAFSGLETMKAAYKHAVENGYRFYSYGDASLLERFPESSFRFSDKNCG